MLTMWLELVAWPKLDLCKTDLSFSGWFGTKKKAPIPGAFLWSAKAKENCQNRCVNPQSQLTSHVFTNKCFFDDATNCFFKCNSVGMVENSVFFAHGDDA